MSRNSKAKRDARQKKERKPSQIQRIRELQLALNDLFNPAKLTTPGELNDDIRQFCAFVSHVEPFFIDVQPEL